MKMHLAVVLYSRRPGRDWGVRNRREHNGTDQSWKQASDQIERLRAGWEAVEPDTDFRVEGAMKRAANEAIARDRAA